MKFNALFEYDKFGTALAEYKGYHGFEDEVSDLENKVKKILFVPECYKEVSIYNMPVSIDDICDTEDEDESFMEDAKFVKELMNDFAEKNNLKRICITEDIPELGML